MAAGSRLGRMLVYEEEKYMVSGLDAYEPRSVQEGTGSIRGLD
jgi:hypothetical protein